ncbi:MAG: hypothetical protein ABI193_23345 [Minicystis sp.]
MALQTGPREAALETCIEVYRKQAKAEPIETVWKRFRASTCGGRWFLALQGAYGHRCLYCDHAPVRSIDHRDAKSRSVGSAFAWKNFRASCGDCNHLKGMQKIVDPVSEDPRAFITYDVSTGKPAPILAAKTARRKKAEVTIRLLDFQTLNEARRSKRHRVLDALTRFLAGEAGFDAARVRQELSADEPHRAIVRDLVLGADANLHQWSALVRQAMRRLPFLRTWALSPTG